MTDCGITAAEVELVLRRALQRDLSLLDFTLNTFSDKVGFMGDHNMLTVHYCDANGPGEYSFFLKLLPKSDRYKSIVQNFGLFTKEKEMYEKLLPLMAKSLGRRMPAADCYLIRDDGCIVLEDLSRMGYKLWDKYAFLGRRQAEAALKAVAALHAGSLAVEVGTDALMPRHADHCYEALIADSSSDNIVVRQWHFSSLKTCCSLLQKMQCYKSRVAGATDWDSVFEKLHRAWDHSALVTQGFSAKYRNVLSHGDLWVNNVLFKDELDRVEAVLVDFQTYRYSPPILDLLMLLHCATSREFRAQHQKELIELYFRELENLLRAAGIENPIDLKQLQESAKEFDHVAAVLAARHIPTILKQGLTDATQLSKNYTAETATKESAFDQSDLLLGIFGGSELGKHFEERMKNTLDSLIEILGLSGFFEKTST